MAASNSPLLPYANARILVPNQGSVSLVDGRWVEAAGNSYLVKCFLKRSQYSGVSSGSKMIPIPSQLDGRMLPGASGESFFYRGYALDWAEVPDSWDLETSDESALPWEQVIAQYLWLKTGLKCHFRFGNDPIMPDSRIERSSGVFGGQGIDDIVYSEIGGVEIQVTGGEIQS